MRRQCYWTLIPLTMLLGCTQPPATSGTNAPFVMPDDYVMTPNGYTPKSCLIEIKLGEKLAPSGNIIEPDGTVRGVDKCARPSYDLDGKEIVIKPDDWNTGVPCGGGVSTGGSGNPGYQAYVFADLNGVTWISSYWTVPDYPEYNGKQITYLWNGLLSSNKAELLQPVLGWNAGYCQPYNGHDCNYYSVSAWNWQNNNTANTYYSTPVRVYPGDTISGSVSSQGGGYWTVTVDVNGAWATGLETGTCTAEGYNYWDGTSWHWVDDPSGCIPTTSSMFTRAIPAAMEVHPPPGSYYTVCNQLPGSYYDYFQNVTVYDQGYYVTPSWQTQSDALCNFYAYATNPMLITWAAQ